MKLSVSAYRAHASAHKKILDTAYQLNYGSTQASSTQQHYKVEPISSDDPHQHPLSLGPHHPHSTHSHHTSHSSHQSHHTSHQAHSPHQSHPSHQPHSVHQPHYTHSGHGSHGPHLGGPGGGALLTADNSGSDTPATSPRSPLNTSRDEEDDSSNAASSDCKSPSQRYAGSDSGSSSQPQQPSEPQSQTQPQQNEEQPKPPTSTSGTDQVRSGLGSGVGGNGGGGSLQSVAEATAKAATQSWRNIRAVMAYYHTLRKIKRTKSNQRWMKLRTTVQISSAIQKKPPLKREDSFLKRFSTRQIPETQETVEDTGSEGGGAQQHAPRRRRRPAKLPRTVVNPDENFYFYWLLALTICVLYNMWALIVRQSFPEFQSMASGFWMLCDGVSDVVFLLDVGVQLRTGYLEQGLMVYDSRKLAGHYLHSRAFLLDLGALCPLDLLQVRFGPQPMLRFPRFLKVYRAVNYYYMVESRTVWPNLWRVVNLIHILLILAHWFGCFYFLLSEAEGFQGDWVYPYRPGDYATLTRKYLGSLYWSTLTLTTIGDLPTPETNAEQTMTVDGPRSLPRRGLKSRLLQFNTDGGYVFTIVSYLIGVFIFATIVGQVGNVITNRNANRLEFERLLDGAKTYMRHHKVPSGMKKRVLRWYDYSWSRGRIQGGGDINTALGLLPDKLKTELALHVNLSVLKKVTIFQECQPEFLHDLVLKMKAYIFTPGDSICRKGEVAREMFIIADGILEVISETGRVLTTMKAGDFFGEIGILNLDGLNKRTADVRSVGYSELFSLSREDVLAAMKDYPEAQEILQSLGRKRLMEVRNSARQPSRASSKHHRSQKEGDSTVPTASSPDHARTLVSKLKSEAKGLRNALRKSRNRRSDESLELQPLHGGGTPPRHPLRRMPKVRSDDADGEEQGEPVVSPLGAGLPLLSRLRLLKEKQDNEDRVTSPGSIVSPPATAGLPPDTGDQHQSHEPEVVGAGLPLLQRLLLLKAKEDKERNQPSSGGGTASSGVVGVSPSGGLERRSRSPSPALSPSQKTVSGKVSFRDRIFSVRATTAPLTSSAPDSPKKSPIPTSPPFPISPPSASTPDVVRDTRDSNNSTNPPNIPETQPLLEPGTSDDTGPWSKLKQAAIVRENTNSRETTTNIHEVRDLGGNCQDNVSAVSVSGNSANVKRTKPGMLHLTNRTKNYESVDDLSPEYCGLPFVKKLKILNERQKLAELESAIQTRSVSLDIPESQQYDDSTLTRSHSEASAMHRRNSTVRLCVQNDQPPTSPESNETPERRNLKSILKKLSEDAKPKPKVPARKSEESRSTASNSDLRQLLRAPTIEGYAARHSKLAKSVTFDRDTLPSPPGAAPTAITGLQPAATGNISLGPATTPSSTTSSAASAAVVSPGALSPTSVVISAPEIVERVEKGDSPTEGVAVTTVTSAADERTELPTVQEEKETEKCERDERVVTTNQVKLIKPPLDEHEYFGTALIAIKQVISAHLQEMQHKFQQRFDRLEAEVRSRDAVIGRLRQHIHDLERSLDEDYTGSDSADTVITRANHSWDDSTNQESLELQELPESMRPQRAWSPPQDSVVLDLDTTDTESELDSSDHERDNFGHNANWEVEMLAAQMRQQRRSASFDQNAAPRRRLLCRGYSADAGGRD